MREKNVSNGDPRFPPKKTGRKRERKKERKEEEEANNFRPGAAGIKSKGKACMYAWATQPAVLCGS